MRSTPAGDEAVVKRGTFLYAGEVTCDVRIVRLAYRPGTGDYEDPPELALDQPGPYFQVQLGSTTERGRFNAGGEGAPSLEEAMQVAERLAPGVAWTP